MSERVVDKFKYTLHIASGNDQKTLCGVYNVALPNCHQATYNAATFFTTGHPESAYVRCPDCENHPDAPFYLLRHS